MKIGCDIVENKRLENKNETFLNHVLSEKEKDLYKTRNKAEFLAGRFAAKEAILKCLPDIKKYQLCDIEILNHEDGKPYCNIEGIVDISISHEKDYTIAVALYDERK